MLVDLGLTNAEVVAKARQEAQAAGVGVVELLLANKVIRPADVTQAKAAQFGAEVVHLANLRLDDEVIAIIPRNIAKKYRVVPIFKTDGKVAVAIADPSDLNTIDSLTHLLNSEIELRVASEPDIEAAVSYTHLNWAVSGWSPGKIKLRTLPPGLSGHSAQKTIGPRCSATRPTSAFTFSLAMTRRIGIGKFSSITSPDFHERFKAT